MVITNLIVRAGAVDDPAFLSKLTKLHSGMEITYEEFYLFQKTLIILIRLKAKCESNVMDRILNNVSYGVAKVQGLIVDMKIATSESNTPMCSLM